MVNRDDILHKLVKQMDGLSRVRCGFYVAPRQATDDINLVDCDHCVNGDINPVLLGDLSAG